MVRSWSSPNPSSPPSRWSWRSLFGLRGASPAGQGTPGDQTPPSVFPPGSAPGWWLEGSGEDADLPRAKGRPRRLAMVALALTPLSVLGAAVVAKARISSIDTFLVHPQATGITLDDVLVEGNLRLSADAFALDIKPGYNECFLPDPLGLGPYSPYFKSRGPILARVAVPQEGGHTQDLGFDVIVHFHGGEAVRKQFVEVVSGAVFVAVDLGNGSGPYANGFGLPDRWPLVKAEITRALRERSGDERAHIRHLALSSWSAGYGAVNQILKVHGDAGIDAVVLLDSMHVGRNLAAPRQDGSLESLSADSLRPLFDFAGKASQGKKTFVLTHSNIVPEGGYASVRRSADLLLHDLHLERAQQERRVGVMDQLTTVDHGRFHVWGFGGRYEKAHCAHTTLLGPIVRDLLEPTWQTPPMNRDVPPTPAPILGR
ncbi:MAG: hypothetical protein JW751_14440 [Polyangiaceae bacterium]|nr:hypothetical protein [Polyangiaceae bacterium]